MDLYNYPKYMIRNKRSSLPPIVRAFKIEHVDSSVRPSVLYNADKTLSVENIFDFPVKVGEDYVIVYNIEYDAQKAFRGYDAGIRSAKEFEENYEPYHEFYRHAKEMEEVNSISGVDFGSVEGDHAELLIWDRETKELHTTEEMTELYGEQGYDTTTATPIPESISIPYQRSVEPLEASGRPYLLFTPTPGVESPSLLDRFNDIARQPEKLASQLDELVEAHREQKVTMGEMMDYCEMNFKRKSKYSWRRIWEWVRRIWKRI